MFQNMGPAPSPRSGHAIAAVGTRIFVLGGESSPRGGDEEDDSAVHVLETGELVFLSLMLSF